MPSSSIAWSVLLGLCVGRRDVFNQLCSCGGGLRLVSVLSGLNCVYVRVCVRAHARVRQRLAEPSVLER